MTPELLTIADIAAMLRRSRRTVAEEWVQRPDFPKPVYAPTRATRLWSRADVERWAAPKETRHAAP
jgi:predicted DNA-binding transcriptional regulator AlpA